MPRVLRVTAGAIEGEEHGPHGEGCTCKPVRRTAADWVPVVRKTPAEWVAHFATLAGGTVPTEKAPPPPSMRAAVLARQKPEKAASQDALRAAMLARIVPVK